MTTVPRIQQLKSKQNLSADDRSASTQSPTYNQWTEIAGIVIPGDKVASGQATNSPFPRGTIEMQTPFLKAMGLDLYSTFAGTLNVSIFPQRFEMSSPAFTFQNVKWIETFPAETFSFSPCEISFADMTFAGYIYYPHPESKIGHFKNQSTLEIIAPYMPGVSYESRVLLKIRSDEIKLL